MTLIAQGEQRIQQLLDNEKLLSVGFSLDRTEYLPQEAAAITLKMKNPTERPLSVIWPLYIFTTSSVQADGRMKPLMPPPYRDTSARIDSDVPELTLQGGEERVVHIDSFAVTSDSETYDPMPPWGSVPQEPGRYQIEFNHGSVPTAHIIVVDAKLGQQAVVRLTHDILIPSSEEHPAKSVHGYRWAFELKEGSVSHICLSRTSAAIAGNHPEWSLRVGTLNGGPHTLVPHKRIAQTTDGVASIQLAVNGRDQFKVTWTDLQGNKHVGTFDADLNRVDDE